MDEDVKLSMTQAHQKWLVKMGVFGMLSVLGAFAFWVHDCNATDATRTCTDAVIDPVYSLHDGVLKCPDPRQTPVFPQGMDVG